MWIDDVCIMSEQTQTIGFDKANKSIVQVFDQGTDIKMLRNKVLTELLDIECVQLVEKCFDLISIFGSRLSLTTHQF